MDVLIKSALSYSPHDGVVRWVRHPRRYTHNGMEAGHLGARGYRVLKIGGRNYFVHRIAWFLHYGSWPVNVIDHIDGDRCNNRISNLRDVTQHVNCKNRHVRKSKTGFLGAYKDGHTFKAQAYKQGQLHYLGNFPTALEAHRAYEEFTK